MIRIVDEATNTITDNEKMVAMKGEYSLIKDGTFGNSNEYLIIKNDKAIKSIIAKDINEAKAQFNKYMFKLGIY